MRKSQQEIATVSKNFKDNKTVSKGNLSVTMRLTYAATLAAICVSLKILGQFITISASLKISLIYTGWMLAGLMLDPLSAASVGFVSDILGFMIVPTGSGLNPFITMGNTLFPMIISLSIRFLPIKNKVVTLSIGTALSLLICTIGINSTALYIYYFSSAMDFLTFLVTQRAVQVLVVGINLALTTALLPAVNVIKQHRF